MKQNHKDLVDNETGEYISMQAEYEVDLVRTWELPQRRDEMTSDHGV